MTQLSPTAADPNPIPAFQSIGEDVYRAVFDASSDGILVIEVTPDGRLRLARLNQSASRMTGVPLAAAVQRTADEIFLGSFFEFILSGARKCIQSGVEACLEQKAVVKEKEFTLSTRFAPLKDAAGKVQRVICTLRDVSPRKQAEAAIDEVILGWTRAIDQRDHEPEGHTQLIVSILDKFARGLGIGKEERLHIRRGALLHDVGKILIPEAILLKPGPLDEEEWQIVRKHPQYAYDLLYPIAALRPALDIPYCHHEYWDGSGYPRGLRGDQIPLSARLFCIVDVWDALSSDRNYRKAWPEDKVIDYIESMAGVHFDPDLVPTFIRLILLER